MIETRTYYYARVSTSNQNLDRQMKAFRDLGALDAKQLAHQHIDHAGFLERHAQRRYKDQLGDGRTAHPTGNSGGGCQKAAVYHGDNTQDSS